MKFTRTNRQLCQMIKSNKNSGFATDDKLEIILRQLRDENAFSAEQLEIIRHELAKHFYPYYHKRWMDSKVSRKQERFEKFHETWLQAVFSVEIDQVKDINLVDNSFQGQNMDDITDDINSIPMETDETNSLQKPPKRGCPSVTFGEGSRITQKRLAGELAEDHTNPESAKALEMRKTGPYDSCKIDINDVKTYTNLTKMLAMFLDSGFSSRKYENFRKHNYTITGCNLYPPYKIMNDIKMETYPEIMTFSEIGAEADLFSLLQHTIKKILLITNREEWEMYPKRGLTLVAKWDMDGASGQQRTRQKWNASKGQNDPDDGFDDEYEEPNDEQVERYEILGDDDECKQNQDTNKEKLSDETVFGVSFVPLQLKAGEEVIWFNEKPSSIYKCRPIKFEFKNESYTLVRET